MMKRAIIALALLAGLSHTALCQTPYISEPDPKHPSEPMLTGILTKYILQNHSAFGWFTSNQNGYTPGADLVNGLTAAKDQVSFVVFGGTWCDDTRYILPKFFKWLEQAGFPDKQVSFFGVNRSKETPGNITKAMGILNVPTIIAMKNGVEIGRVVEYGKTGKWDVELADIIRSK